MDPPGLGVFRRQTLTNSAAEFVETRAGMQTVAQIVDPGDMDELKAVSEFVPELDQFVPKGVVIDMTKCYQESRQRMTKFEQTLKSFVRLLHERNVDKELNVEIKPPGELTMEDALAIIGKIQEGRNSKQVKSCKDFIYRCYRKAESKKGIAEAVLTMIPNDAYGSVISGGFTLILAAVEKHAEHRKAMQDFLAEIPDQLERLHRLSQLHLNSIRVHAQRDAVLVSIFVVLERIVDHLTQSWRGKVKNKVKVIFGNSKPKSSTDVVVAGATEDSAVDPKETKQSVTSALEEFRRQVDLFQEEVEFADSERLGRVENMSTFVQDGMLVISKELRHNRAELEYNRGWIEGFMKGSITAKYRPVDKSTLSEDRSQKKLIHLLLTSLYQFHASNPAFDPKTGQLNLEEMVREEHRSRQKSLTDKYPGTPASFQASNQEIVEKWIAGLASKTGLQTYDYLEDTRAILTSQQRLDLDQIDQCNYISWTSPEYKSWLKIDRDTSPSLLNISLQTPPGIHNPINALSFTTARTAISFRMQRGHDETEDLKPHSSRWPVLAFFCRQRNMASRNVNISGAPALVRSLCAQLLEWVVLFRPGIDLETSIKTADFFRGARKNMADGLSLFRALLVVLRDDHENNCREQDPARPRPQPQPVWILIEGLSSLSVAKSTSESHDMISALWDIIEQVSRPRVKNSSERHSRAPRLAIKLLVTDAFGNSPINRVQGAGVYLLHVPDTPTRAGGARGVLDGGDAAREFSRLVDQHLGGDNNRGEEETKGKGGASGNYRKKKTKEGKGRSKVRVKSESESEESSSGEEEEEEEEDDESEDKRSSSVRRSSGGEKTGRKADKKKKKSSRRGAANKQKKKGKKVESESESEDESGKTESEDEESGVLLSALDSASARRTENKASRKGEKRKARRKHKAKRATESGSTTDEDSD